MNWAAVLAVTCLIANLQAADSSSSPAPDAPGKYVQDFSKIPAGDPPDELMVDGQFAVREEAGNKFLELPGAPLETYWLLFGPSTASGFQAQARVWGTKAGRKQPVFALGLNGQGGFKLRISPAKQVMELLLGEEVLTTAPFQWQSGEWTTLRLQVRTVGTGIVAEGKAWQGAKEPEGWLLKQERSAPLPAGRAGLWGLPFSGTPLRFDDFQVIPVP